VVEDEDILRRVFSRILDHSGYEVLVARDGESAWETLRAEPVDLLITDHIMPGMTGMQLIRRMRLAGLTHPIILITATLPQLRVDAGPWLRIATTLTKPFYAAQLQQAVTGVLQASRENPIEPGTLFAALADAFTHGSPILEDDLETIPDHPRTPHCR
jgi:CheY-like chemotaxis protein